LKKIAEKILAYRWPIIILVVVGTIYLGLQLKNMSIDADILRSLPEDDPNAVLLQQISEKFGGNNMGIIILETDNIYQTQVLEHVRSITDTLSYIDGILSVSSITNIINIKGSEMGIEVGQLVDEYELPETPEEFESLRNNVEANEMYKGTIVSDDGTSTLIIFTLKNGANVSAVAKTVIAKTEELQLPKSCITLAHPCLLPISRI